jgi:protein phosphatase
MVASLSKSMLIQQTSLPQDNHERLLGAPRGTLLVVADGMGGHGGGDVASSVAVDVMTHYVLNIMPWFFRLDDDNESDLTDELKTALERCHGAVREAAEADESVDNRMGTTLTMAYVVWPRLYVVHVGDSRCYLFRRPELQQITKDHTLAQQMVDQDVLEEDRVEGSKWSNILWNSVGGGTDDMDPDVYKAQLERGDTLLLCSDGLTKHVDDDAIRPILERNDPAEKATKSLIDAATDGGGTDNITAVVARFP